MNAARAEEPPSKTKRKPRKPRKPAKPKFIWGVITLKRNSQLGSLFQEIMTNWLEVYLVKVIYQGKKAVLLGDEAEYGYLAQRTLATIEEGQKTILGTKGQALSNYVMNNQNMVPMGLLVCCSPGTWAELKVKFQQDLHFCKRPKMPRC